MALWFPRSSLTLRYDWCRPLLGERGALDRLGISHCICDRAEAGDGKLELYSRGEVRRHWVAAKEGTPVINNGPRNSGAYLLGVRVPDRETLLPVQDVVEFDEFLVVVAVVAKK